MRSKNTYRGVSGFLGLTALILTGCPGGDPPGTTITCGPNTEEVNGKCVSTVDEAPCGAGASRNPDTGQCEPDVECGPGTTYDAQTQECEPDSVCGPGTTLNEATGECEPDVVCGDDTTFDPNTGACRPNTVCGAGTHFDAGSGECVPDENCGTGTTFDPDTQTCVPDLVCGPGLTNVDGMCLSALDLILSEADAAEATPDRNDPAVGGTAENVTLEVIGERAVLTGTIQRPVDLDGDTVNDQDLDVWRFTGRAGQMLRIRVLSSGAFQPGFTLTGPNGYYREPQVGFTVDADREVVLPYDGEYDLTVLPSLVLQGASDPIGGDDALYAAIVEEVAWPTLATVSIPETGEPASAAGALLDLSDNFFQLSTGATSPVVLETTTIATNTEPVLMLFDTTGAFQREVEFRDSSGVAIALATALYDDTVGLVAVLDWRTSNGIDADFALHAVTAGSVDLGDVPADGAISWPREGALARNGISFTFSATAGQVVLSDLNGLSTTNSDTVLMSPSGAVLRAGSYSTNPHPTFLAQETGTYRWLILNTGDSDARIAPAIQSFTPRMIGPFDGSSEQTASFSGDHLGPLVRPGGEWFVVETSAAALVRADFERTSGMPDFEIYALNENGTLGTRRTNGQNTPSSLRRLHRGPDRTLIRYSPGATGRTPDPVVLDWRMDVTVSPMPAASEVEPNDAMDATQAVTAPITLLGQIADEELDIFTVTLDSPLQAGEALVIDIESVSERATSTWMRIREPGSTLEDPELYESAQLPLSRWMLLPDDNLSTFVLELEGTAADGLEYVLDIRRVSVRTETEPNDDSGTANDLGTMAIADLPVEVIGIVQDKAGFSAPIFSDFYQITLNEPLPSGVALRVRVDDLVEGADLDLTLSYAGSPTGQVLTSRHEEAVLLAAPADGVPLTIQVSDTQTAGEPNNLYRLVVDTVPSLDVEPNNSTAASSPLGTLVADSGVSTFGIGKREPDYYRIDLDGPFPAGEAIRVRQTIATARGIIDVTVRDGAGNELLFNGHYAGELVFAPVGEAGPFYVQVAPDRSTANTFAELYLLEVERFTTNDVIEREPNDDTGTAQAISTPSVVQGSANDATPDLYVITLDADLAAGEVLLIDGFAPYNTDDLSVRVLDDVGAELAVETDILPYLEVDLPTKTTGATYFVEVLGHTNLAVDEEERYELAIDIAVP